MEQIVYKTVQEAAIAGTRAAIELARRDNWEYGGVVIAVKGGFIVSELVTSKSTEGIDLSAAYPGKWKGREKLKRADLPGLTKIIKAFFHVHLTHIENNGELFSGADVNTASNLRTLAYVGSTKNGKVFMIDASSAAALKASAQRLRFDMVGMLQHGEQSSVAALGAEVFAGDHAFTGATEARQAA